MATNKDIVIVGAGAAGIAAARRLKELLQDFIVLEAAPQIGGRCRTDRDTFGLSIDLGAHWLHSPALNPLTGFAAAHGISIGGELHSRYSRNGVWLDDSETDACTSYVESCFARIDAAGMDIAIPDLFPDRSSPWHAVFEAEIQAKQGLAPEQSSSGDFVNYVWEGADLPVLDGYGTLLARLAADLPIRINTPVTRIDRSPRQHMLLETADGSIAAKHVILTVSNAALSHIHFTPSLPDWKQAAIAALPMGHCNKIALRFTQPVFGDLDGSLIVPLRSARESVELVVREDGKDAATCLVNGPFARDLAAAGKAAMKDYALERLAEIFGGAIRQAVVDEAVFANWDADPYIGGCYSVAMPSAAHLRQDLARPVDDRLFFAGEATSLQFMGDVHGAWFTGIAAAEAAARAQ